MQSSEGSITMLLTVQFSGASQRCPLQLFVRAPSFLPDVLYPVVSLFCAILLLALTVMGNVYYRSQIFKRKMTSRTDAAKDFQS
jgi:hypothetical protein